MKLLDYHHLRAAEVKGWDRVRMEQEMTRDHPVFARDVERLLPRVREPYAPDKLIHVTRDQAFDNIAALCERYRIGSDAERVYIRSRVDRTSAGLMGLFGLRAAILGARQHSRELIRLGLIAFAIADLEEGDVRDTLISVTVLFHCARLAVGAEDAGILFRETAALSGPAMKVLLGEYPDHVSSLGAMGIYQVETAEGVGFTTKPPKPPGPSS